MQKKWMFVFLFVLMSQFAWAEVPQKTFFVKDDLSSSKLEVKVYYEDPALSVPGFSADPYLEADLSSGVDYSLNRIEVVADSTIDNARAARIIWGLWKTASPQSHMIGNTLREVLPGSVRWSLPRDVDDEILDQLKNDVVRGEHYVNVLLDVVGLYSFKRDYSGSGLEDYDARIDSMLNSMGYAQATTEEKFVSFLEDIKDDNYKSVNSATGLAGVAFSLGGAIASNTPILGDLLTGAAIMTKNKPTDFVMAWPTGM